MFDIKGKYATAFITTDNIEEEAIAQVTELVNSPASFASKIVIMPDVHAGKGCVIGTTMTIVDRVVPNLVGVDIGCGVSAYKITSDINFKDLQDIIDRYVPSGFNVHSEASDVFDEQLRKLKTPLEIDDITRIRRSIGTLGGGNHFISVEMDGPDCHLVIHTGSRILGTRIAKYHQGIAEEGTRAEEIANMIRQLKAQGRQAEIQPTLEKFKKEQTDFANTKALAFLQGAEMEDYLNDVKIAQEFASLNRKMIAVTIMNCLGLKYAGHIESVHNYIDTDEMVLRKGAIKASELFLVPLNMRDGTLICAGSSNPDWNHSAPHGAGRAMSRSRARKELNVEDFKETMKDVWSASVNTSTLDEAPDAYKPAEEIKAIVSKEYEVVSHLKPVFNFKASE